MRLGLSFTIAWAVLLICRSPIASTSIVSPARGTCSRAPELARSQPAISNQELADRSWMVERAATLNCELKKGQISSSRQLRNTLRKDFQEQGLDHLLPWSPHAAVAVKLIERRDEDCQIDETERMALNQDTGKYQWLPASATPGLCVSAAGLGLQRAMRGSSVLQQQWATKIGVTSIGCAAPATGRPANHPDPDRLGEQRPADRALFAAALSRQAHAAIGLVCPRCRQFGLPARGVAQGPQRPPAAAASPTRSVEQAGAGATATALSAAARLVIAASTAATPCRNQAPAPAAESRRPKWPSYPLGWLRW